MPEANCWDPTPVGGAKTIWKGGTNPNGNSGAIESLSEAAPVVTFTTTGTVFTGACEYAGVNVRAVSGTVNLAVYDATSATGTPIHTMNNVAIGPLPWMGAGTNHRRLNSTGVHVVVSGGGTITADALAGA